MMQASDEYAIKILRSWHLVEFFQPYDLPEKLLPEEEMVRITNNELHQSQDTVLPWINPQAKSQLGGDPSKKLNYVLYLGLFDKGLLERICHDVFAEEQDITKVVEFEQRYDNEGETCFAKVILDEYGTPSFDSLSVSTLPWALGHLLAGTAHTLTIEKFKTHCQLLKEQLNRITHMLPVHPNNNQRITLNASGLIALIESLYQWASFRPLAYSHFAFKLDWFEVKDNKKEVLETNTLQEAVLLDVDDIETSDEESVDKRTLPILNSFYIEDIEKAIASIMQGQCGSGLLAYLSINKHKHADLYTQPGLHLIHKHFAPHWMPAGRWPAEPTHPMTLMQQFAINTAVYELAEEGLLSVNGPPGTGKTTLLRDIFAHNIVERSRVLSGFESVNASIDDKGFPDLSLSGFEMVVTSSNNAAVENISKELPLAKSLANEFQTIDYLKPVANQLSASSRKNILQPLAQDAQCWGTISVVMGRKKNRADFVNRLFFIEHHLKDTPQEINRSEEQNFLNLWRWKKLTNTLTFSQAKAAFIQKAVCFDELVAELGQFNEIIQFLADMSQEEYTAAAQTKLAKLSAENDSFQQQVEELNKQQELINDSLEVEELSLQQLQSQPLAWWTRWFKRKHYIDYCNQLHAINDKRITLKRSKLEVKQEIHRLNKLIETQKESIKQAEWKYKQACNAYQDKKEALIYYQQRFPQMVVPDNRQSINDPGVQRVAFWQNEAINRLRSELFISALDLHQAWLKEALAIKHFREKAVYNISDLLKDTPVDQPQGVWRTLFMIVPVISTTFASLGRMLSTLSASQIGWLMIDEAGQAIPQAAVGGIWRAKRTLVVGDPLQIEPVFTTPPKLVDELIKAVLNDDYEHWTPINWSVQQVADRANPYGCQLQVGEKTVWIGIPLWVHRRCIDPMFSLANQIAYNQRMIHGLNVEKIQPQPHVVLGNNRWFHSQGTCTTKQYKAELGRDTLAILFELLNAKHSLSDVYIISPFKAVKQHLANAIDEQKYTICQLANYSQREYFKWRRFHIGTVHTFQGKENNTVILVLGCDPQNAGGAVWAASKPNLLNVALTRAKQHFFVVGDLSVWQDKPYFQLLASALTLEISVCKTTNMQLEYLAL